ncbi:hypothetical protein ATO6_12955 [Oceanicola sp. 22II-s10i]|uniref:adenosylcobinamide-GDP ribazoletransferase n=1 Tax=Oceanicola sp. 22II-s10i TaxID=1317116 RepID=UPI000B51F600|nr:adenosylcobinamide-GDP ribazoletransferase [Oceanicola sp. 22II-s10i]OWU84573.1 hypothetical protein ATO6_12955 [Oceanicola sp. 22II-s10i]
MTDSRPHPRDIAAALGLLSRLPLNAPLLVPSGVWAFPLAGAVLGALAATAAALALSLGLPPSLAALVALATAVVLTGALHEDGLADVADGFWGGWTTERRLEIMKDSRIGTYGVVALVLSLAARWQALALILGAGHGWTALIAAGALSRAAMPAVMTALPHARRDGLSRSVGRPGPRPAWIAAAIAAAIALILLDLRSALAACVLTLLAALGTATLAKRKIGGQTGDTLGATQQVAEIAILTALAI